MFALARAQRELGEIDRLQLHFAAADIGYSTIRHLISLARRFLSFDGESCGCPEVSARPRPLDSRHPRRLDGWVSLGNAYTFGDPPASARQTTWSADGSCLVR